MIAGLADVIGLRLLPEPCLRGGDRSGVMGIDGASSGSGWTHADRAVLTGFAT